MSLQILFAVLGIVYAIVMFFLLSRAFKSFPENSWPPSWQYILDCLRWLLPLQGKIMLLSIVVSFLDIWLLKNFWPRTPVLPFGIYVFVGALTMAMTAISLRIFISPLLARPKDD